MHMLDFFNALESDYSNQKKFIAQNCDKESYKDSLKIIIEIYDRLKNFIRNSDFECDQDEINYFKHIKPKFQCDLIFFNKILQINSKVPIGSIEKKRDFFIKQLDKMSTYFEENIEFINYFRSNDTEMDHIYFLRKNAKYKRGTESVNSEIDYSQCTGFDIKIAKMLAHQRLETYMYIELKKLENIDSEIPVKNESNQNKSELKWTDSKIALIELIYSLQSSSVFNNGNIDIKTLSSAFESFFNIDLGDTYQGFKEIKDRKNSQTKLLDKLQSKLLDKIEKDNAYKS